MYNPWNRSKWTQEQIALLGTATDPVIAKKTGHTERVVGRKRKELNIPSWQSQHPFNKKANKRKHHLKSLYDITVTEYDEMLKGQHGMCAICGMTPEENSRRLAVDHCHETGKPRGLLCNSCNAGLGMFQDNRALLLRAIGYLKVEV